MSYLSKNQNELLVKARSKARGLNHPLRQTILSLIKGNRNRICVTDIYKKLRIEQSVASQQLAIMRNQKFVKTDKRGKVVWYSVNDAEIKRFLQVCAKM